MKWSSEYRFKICHIFGIVLLNSTRIFSIKYHKLKNEKILRGFEYSKNMANIEALYDFILSSIHLLFMKSWMV